MAAEARMGGNSARTRTRGGGARTSEVLWLVAGLGGRGKGGLGDGGPPPMRGSSEVGEGRAGNGAGGEEER
nr:unnamed protein product [Digitaria exilis]